MYQEYAARHATVRALEVIPIIGGVPSSDRQFVVDGVGVLDALTFRALYGVVVNGNGSGHKQEAKVTTKPATKRKYTRHANPAAVAATPTATDIIAAETNRLAEPLIKPRNQDKNQDRKPTLSDHIVKVLSYHQPMTSGEIFEHLHQSGISTTSGSVYQCCRDLRESGRIESRADDDGDGRMKWFLRGSGGDKST